MSSGDLQDPTRSEQVVVHRYRTIAQLVRLARQQRRDSASVEIANGYRDIHRILTGFCQTDVYLSQKKKRPKIPSRLIHYRLRQPISGLKEQLTLDHVRPGPCKPHDVNLSYDSSRITPR